MDNIFTQCWKGNAVAIQLWMDSMEDNLNRDDLCLFPLHWACQEGSVVEMLNMRGT